MLERGDGAARAARESGDEQVAERDAREAERREAGIAESVERLRAQPEIVIDRLAETRSVWNEADVEREVRSALGVRSGHDVQIASATRAVVEASLAIDTDAYTTKRVVSEERAVFAAAATLADRQRGCRSAGAGCAAACKLDFSRPGKPTDNAFCESFNGRVRAEFLNPSYFETLNQARRAAGIWRQEYNEFRPHSTLGKVTPATYARAALARRVS